MQFKDLNLNKFLVNALDDLGFETPTPIQEQAEVYRILNRKIHG